MCEQFAELLLAPSVTDVASGRGLRIRLVSGLPLLHMERPKLRGVRRLTREFVDGTAAVLVLLLVAPVLASIAATTKRTSRGPVFIRQECVGRDGRSFGMLTFRSMVVGADRVADELAPESDGNGILFKKDDPCVTRIGRVLRRYALDKLPQLLNVVGGDVSHVGPRPPLQSDVDRYGFDIYRWFLVEPGLTGLWQISGSSNLSWDDSVPMDLRYVENWSLTFDLTILWKTVGAVLRGSEAY